MAEQDNLSVVLYGIDDLRLEQTPLPSKPGSNEVILESHTVGICGSDVHFLTEGRLGPFILKDPIILGHETSATVVEVGPDVKNLKPGDRVAVEPQVPCRICSACKIGRYNYCPDTNFFATPPCNGSLCRKFKHAADFCFKLPDNVSYEDATLMEPLAVAVHALRRANLSAGQTVLVTGAGPIGMCMILVAKAFGARAIAISDINHDRVEKAQELGAIGIKIEKGDNLDQLAKNAAELLGCEPDLVVECSGSEFCTSFAIKAAKLGGQVLLVGMGPAEGIKVPLTEAVCKEVNIITSLRYANSYQITLDLIASGRINARPLITHRFKLNEAIEAFEIVKKGKGIKVMIQCKE